MLFIKKITYVIHEAQKANGLFKAQKGATLKSLLYRVTPTHKKVFKW